MSKCGKEGSKPFDEWHDYLRLRAEARSVARVAHGGRPPFTEAAGQHSAHDSGRSGRGQGGFPAMAEIDWEVQDLPNQVSPPDHWQERAACYGLVSVIFSQPPR